MLLLASKVYRFSLFFDRSRNLADDEPFSPIRNIGLNLFKLLRLSTLPSTLDAIRLCLSADELEAYFLSSKASYLLRFSILTLLLS